MGKQWLILLLIAFITGCNLTSSDTETLNDNPASGNPNQIQFYVLLPGDNGANGTPVSCEDSGVGLSTGRDWTPDLGENLTVALRNLMNTAEPSVDGRTFANYWGGRGINVDSVQVAADAATIELSSTDQELILSGACYDGALQSQLLLTVFQNQAIASAYITYNGQNLKQLFDASGLVGNNDAYTRLEANRGANTNPTNQVIPATLDPRTPQATLTPTP
jgi:hypothetical protein